MNVPRRDGDRVRFVVVPDGHPVRVYNLAGVDLPPYGVFVDQEGQIIPLILDDTDPFRRMTAGMIFSKHEAFQALKGPTLRSMTNNAARRMVSREIQCSGLARHVREPLVRALADFNRPMWSLCGPIMPHLHICLRGQRLASRKHPERGTVHSLVGGSLAALSLMVEGLIDHDDTERLIETLARDPTFEELPVVDPPFPLLSVSFFVVG